MQNEFSCFRVVPEVGKKNKILKPKRVWQFDHDGSYQVTGLYVHIKSPKHESTRVKLMRAFYIVSAPFTKCCPRMVTRDPLAYRTNCAFLCSVYTGS